MRLRLRVYRLLNPVDADRPAARIIEAALLLLIFLNMLALILESVEEINTEHGNTFIALEFFSVIVFTIEYALRVWSSVEDPKYQTPFAGRLRYMSSTMAIIDLMAILQST